MPVVDFPSLPRATAIELFESWADAVPARAEEFVDTWSAHHPWATAGPASFQIALEWVRDQLVWDTETVDDPDLPAWLVPGSDPPSHRPDLIGTASHLDPPSGRLVDRLCAWATIRLRVQSRARLFLAEGAGQFRHHWYVGDSLAGRRILQPSLALHDDRAEALKPFRPAHHRDFIAWACRAHESFADDLRKTAGGQFLDGSRLTLKGRLGRGDLFIIDRIDDTTLSLTLDAAILAHAHADAIDAFIEALSAARGSRSVQRTSEGLVVVTAPTQTRTGLNAWAIKWWRPQLPDEPRPRIPDADLEQVAAGTWVIELEDGLARRGSRRVDQLVAQLSQAPGITKAARTDRGVIEIRTDQTAADLIAIAQESWTQVFDEKRVLRTPPART